MVESYRFWAGETCFEDFEGLESLDLDLPLRTDSDFLKEILIFLPKVSHSLEKRFARVAFDLLVHAN